MSPTAPLAADPARISSAHPSRWDRAHASEGAEVLSGSSAGSGSHPGPPLPSTLCSASLPRPRGCGRALVDGTSHGRHQ